MYKVFSGLKRKTGMSREEFFKYWKEKHGVTAMKVIPGLRRYVHNRAVDIPGVENDIDGIAELWFDDIGALRNYWAWRQSDAAKAQLADEKNFVERDEKTWVRLLAEELVLKEK